MKLVQISWGGNALDSYRCNHCSQVQSVGENCEACGNNEVASISDDALRKLDFITDTLVGAGFHIFHEPDEEGFKILYDGSGTAVIRHYGLDKSLDTRPKWQANDNNMNQRMYGALLKFGTEEVFWLDSWTDPDRYKVTGIIVRLIRLMVPRSYTQSRTI